MNDHVKIENITRPVHKNVHVALAAAQLEMGKVVKASENKHFNSKYADLADVLSVAIPALAMNGITFFQPLVKQDGEWVSRTILVHGETGTELSCDVPLHVAGGNMQAFKSATTYAKRIGAESMTGIAPEDDDGNEAAKNPAPEKPKPQVQSAPKGPDARTLFNNLVQDMRRCDTNADMDRWWVDAECKELRAKFPADWQDNLKEEFRKHKADLTAKQSTDNENPFGGG